MKFVFLLLVLVLTDFYKLQTDHESPHKPQAFLFTQCSTCAEL